jgi:prepilin-type N-terminal cleavage/methylation domain-containing protein
MNRSRRQIVRGFSLVELMVAMVAGLIVSAAALSFFFSSLKSNGEYVQSTRLTQELRNTMSLLTRDLRRAGYNDNYMDLLASASTSPLSKIYISGECILYTYDRANGTAGVLDQSAGEIRGIRRVTVANFQGSGKTIGVIELATSDATAHPDCTGTKASYTSFPPVRSSASGWAALSDPSILNITALTFTDLRTNASSNLNLREIGVAMSGQLASSTNFTRSISTTVRVRSDCYISGTFDCKGKP